LHLDESIYAYSYIANLHSKFSIIIKQSKKDKKEKCEPQHSKAKKC